jgi:hypothetical protein
MAEKRMFSKRVISSDAFLDMTPTAQLFYFHLSMMADDDGFVDSTRSVMRSVGASKEDMDSLIAKKFIIYFSDEGVSVIRHWNVSNNIRRDMYKETKYKELKSRLSLDEDNVYTLHSCNEPVTESLQHRNETGTLGERRSDQVNSDQDQKREREYPPPDFSVDDELHPGRKDIVSRIEHHRKFWEQCGLPSAQIITSESILSELKDPMNSFNVKKVNESIKNLYLVISQPGFDPDSLPGKRVPNFRNFLIRWIDRFTNEAKPLEVYRIRAKGKPPPKHRIESDNIDTSKDDWAKEYFKGDV